MDTPLRLAIDFDGTLHNPNDRQQGYKLGKPIPGAVEALKTLHSVGAIIVIHSVWADTDQKRLAMAEWCHHFEIPYDFITNQKPDCDFYIDDKAIYHTSWQNTLQEIAERVLLRDGKQDNIQTRAPTSTRGDRENTSEQSRQETF